MILSIGELLADVTVRGDGSSLDLHGGGAPFNVAVNVKRAGGRAAFVGRVGRDPIGKFLTGYARSVGLDACEVQTDPVRNTTMAFVSLNDGERDFTFFRRDTADYYIEIDETVQNLVRSADVVHLGSLMMSEETGRRMADGVIACARAAGKRISFDVNFRADLFGGEWGAIRRFAPYVEAADIVKFSEDELAAYTGADDLERAARSIGANGKLILVTLGGRGSFYCLNKMSGYVGTVAVKPVDTTGAGDAFFGAVLKELDGLPLSLLTEEKLNDILVLANAAGARATQYVGAL